MAALANASSSTLRRVLTRGCSRASSYAPQQSRFTTYTTFSQSRIDSISSRMPTTLPSRSRGLTHSAILHSEASPADVNSSPEDSHMPLGTLSNTPSPSTTRVQSRPATLHQYLTQTSANSASLLNVTRPTNGGTTSTGWDDVIDTQETIRGKAPASERWAENSKKSRAKMLAMKLEAGKYAGRSEVVNAFGGLQSAIGKLGRTLAQNKVRQEVRLVERYEKPTDKRRRLKSERHRRRFAEMVSYRT